MAPVDPHDPYLVKLTKSFPIEALAPLGLAGLIINKGEFVFKLGLALLFILPIYMALRKIKNPLQILCACFGFFGWLLIMQTKGADDFFQDTFNTPHTFTVPLAVGVFLVGVFQLFFPGFSK